MLLTDAEAPGPESLYCPQGSNACSKPGVCISEVGIDRFPLAGGMKQKADCCRHTHCRVFSALVVMWEPLDISPSSGSHPCT